MNKLEQMIEMLKFPEGRQKLAESQKYISVEEMRKHIDCVAPVLLRFVQADSLIDSPRLRPNLPQVINIGDKI